MHRQKITVVNKSMVSCRLYIIYPTTPFFRLKCNRKGILALGMAEEISIEFEPNEWRYYYDCIRLHCEDENLLVFIYVYLVINEVIFPKHIEMGACALCEMMIKFVDIKCKVPIQFEYVLIVINSHPDFIVSPLWGVILVNGVVRVKITYSPLKLGMASI